MFGSTGAGAEKLLKFKKWFWSIVEKMNNSERQDLVSAYKNIWHDTFCTTFHSLAIAVLFVVVDFDFL